MHMMTWQVLVFKTPEVLQLHTSYILFLFIEIVFRTKQLKLLILYFLLEFSLAHLRTE